MNRHKTLTRTSFLLSVVLTASPAIFAQSENMAKSDTAQAIKTIEALAHMLRLYGELPESRGVLEKMAPELYPPTSQSLKSALPSVELLLSLPDQYILAATTIDGVGKICSPVWKDAENEGRWRALTDYEGPIRTSEPEIAVCVNDGEGGLGVFTTRTMNGGSLILLAVSNNFFGRSSFSRGGTNDIGLLLTNGTRMDAESTAWLELNGKFLVLAHYAAQINHLADKKNFAEVNFCLGEKVPEKEEKDCAEALWMVEQVGVEAILSVSPNLLVPVREDRFGAKLEPRQILPPLLVTLLEYNKNTNKAAKYYIQDFLEHNRPELWKRYGKHWK